MRKKDNKEMRKKDNKETSKLNNQGPILKFDK